jgi:hypothetical protein
VNFISDKSKDEYDVKIRLKNIPSPDLSDPHSVEGDQSIDVSTCPVGYVLFRLVHPVDNRAVKLSRPQVSLVDGDKKRN